MRKHVLFHFFIAVLSQICLSSIGMQAFAQQTYAYRNTEETYTKAIDLLNRQEYFTAQEFFKQTLESTTTKDETKVNSRYYIAFCAMRLQQNSAEYLYKEFIHDYPMSSHHANAQYELAMYYYSKKKYRNAIRAFQLVDVYPLSQERKDEFYFRVGYSYFSLSDYEEASKSFFRLLKSTCPFSIPSNYYFGHIAYQNKNYETALISFLRVKDSPEYANIVPFYIAQIYYLQGKYAALLSFSVPLLSTVSSENALELNKMIGEAYYREKKYTEAIPYLEGFIANSPKSTRDDLFELGFACYQSGEYTRAIKSFEKTLSQEDALTQNSYYLIADCFLRTGKRQNARNAFRLSSRLSYDTDVQENALFSFARLSYELAVQTDAVDAFQKYKRLFPTSYRIDLANQYLAGIFLTTKNYKDALTAMEDIKLKSEPIKGAYQRAAYFRGIEFFNDVQYQTAIDYFEKSQKFPLDPSLNSLALYWKGESLYNLKRFDEAKAVYTEFLYSPQASALAIFNIANYNLAYCYYNKEDFSNALSWFRKYVANEKQPEAVSDKARFNDALLRIADLYFVKRDFALASTFYDDAIKNRASARDYAWFQRGMIYGLVQKPKEKISVMEMIIDSFPRSPYFDDALYETAHTAVTSGDNEKAALLFTKVMTDYSRSSYLSKSILGLALIKYDEKKDEEAMELYKRVVKDFPGSSESRTALQGVKNIYVGQSNAQAFLDYAASIPFANMSKSSEDSLTYESAEVGYMTGDCIKSSEDFTKYLLNFPNGSFALNATFYKAECDFRNNHPDKAAVGYESVISFPKSTFTETSLVHLSSIYYNDKQYEKALLKYDDLLKEAELKSNVVEALTGKMRCSYWLGRKKDAIEMATNLLAAEKVTNELTSESKLIIGRCALAPEVADTTLAIANLLPVSFESSARGAESKYLLSSIYFAKQNFKESQRIIFELVNQIPSYDDWIARGFVLLADNYLAMSDAFQAKSTLESVINNYDGDDKAILPSAVSKLNSILETEKAAREKELKSIPVPDPTLPVENEIEKPKENDQK